MTTIRDVSKLVGVSVATVSRLLNQSGYVSKEAESAIVAAIQKLNYKPNNIARSLAGKKTAAVALMVPDILNPFFPEIARAAEDAAAAEGYTFVLCNTDNNPVKEKRYIETLINKQIDGIIISSYTIQAEQIIALQDRSIPVVAINKPFSGYPIVTITAANQHGGELAVSHLQSVGCQKIAHISGPTDVHASRERTLAYEEQCKAFPWFTPSLIGYGNFTVAGGYQAMKDIYKKHPDVDGVFAGNDLMAAGALKALIELGVKVPEQVKLIGFDGIRMEMVYPEITTISQQIYSVGETAMNYLIRLINNEPVERKNYEFDVELLYKGTT
ncbi:LacI family DNA-binding transcriptional regulator [Paenibacillus arenosi]|uniref:LacI family DNA-binding transcriptional regulator n=1 Tax=Paenibacillus arenosi TaxID=2774142 RepID=A0ABR9AZU8_9BACL|nr:LacI family DNA-binding transcriptional regulator [Paenibacillus arenosi]MBD8499682.1 LacI family DNA-binding transcriptional regulator [Paenibacillus arenosi]